MIELIGTRAGYRARSVILITMAPSEFTYQSLNVCG